jgi:hypothetical protein
MTSFKKPLIAIASAVALVTTALIATPANATVSAAVTVGVTDVATTSKVITTPATPTVPSDNKVDLADTVKFVVTVAANTVVTATATDAKLVSTLDAADAPVTASAGSATFSGNAGSGTTVTFYAFTTKTTTGSVVVSTGGSSATYYLKGTAGPAYNLTAVVPTVANLSGTAEVTALVSDIFGNAITNATISSTVIRATLGAFSYDATDKRYEATLTAPATAGTAIVALNIAAPTEVSAIAKSATEVVGNVTVADLAGQVTALNAKVAELEAKLAAATKLADTNKAKFNNLAKKYNTKVSKKYQVKLIK